MLELAFGFALKTKIVPGIILESKDLDKGNLSKCYEYGTRNSSRTEIVRPQKCNNMFKAKIFPSIANYAQFKKNKKHTKHTHTRQKTLPSPPKLLKIE